MLLVSSSSTISIYISGTKYNLNEGRGEEAMPPVTLLHKPPSEAGDGEGCVPEEAFPASGSTEQNCL